MILEQDAREAMRVVFSVLTKRNDYVLVIT